ncbi:UDP-N-acetylglucosamine--LPS N-acetylglucosamine transferase [Pelagicoccus albus]|uniref:UDP-N-acetylglucosamine--LPS N-acetylglucosamine transferase n=1 Tax=Pelagicoccus albus TaxID=415222 RepID=A0A7X1B9X1_9BACT|nr:UDP-N-acetylglucosamine--LPS N-acetylglucosamine transferase [Pelagicoccus albus]
MGKRNKLVAVSSGGGHWVQLIRLSPALEDLSVLFATVDNHYRNDTPNRPFYLIKDSSLSEARTLLACAVSVIKLLIKEKPSTVISTGAAPGALAVILAKLLGCRTVWIDSVANVRRLSLSGLLVKPFADVCLTQWPQLSKPKGPHYIGSVLCS